MYWKRFYLKKFIQYVLHAVFLDNNAAICWLVVALKNSKFLLVVACVCCFSFEKLTSIVAYLVPFENCKNERYEKLTSIISCLA